MTWAKSASSNASIATAASCWRARARRIERVRFRRAAAASRHYVYLKKIAPSEQAVAETLRCARAMREAGASGLFAPGVADASEIGAIAEGAGMPVNVMARPSVPKLAQLKALGVRRISAATSIFNAAMEGARATAAFLVDGDADALWARIGQPPAYSDLFRS